MTPWDKERKRKILEGNRSQRLCSSCDPLAVQTHLNAQKNGFFFSRGKKCKQNLDSSTRMLFWDTHNVSSDVHITEKLRGGKRKTQREIRRDRREGWAEELWEWCLYETEQCYVLQRTAKVNNRALHWFHMCGKVKNYHGTFAPGQFPVILLLIICGKLVCFSQFNDHSSLQQLQCPLCTLTAQCHVTGSNVI